MSVANPSLRIPGLLAVALIALTSLGGCNRPAPNQPDGANKNEAGDAEEIRTAFDALQEALDEGDPDKIWSLLAKESRDDAEREAKAVQQAFSKLSGKEKAKFAKKLGLSAREITAMTGKLYVKSDEFFTDEMEELSDCDVDRIVMAGESGTLHYTGKRGKEMLTVVREQGQWRFAVPVAKAILK
jgi:hypothetical protein